MEIYKFDDKTIEQRLQDYREIFKTENSLEDFKQLFKTNKRAIDLCNAVWKVPESKCKGKRNNFKLLPHLFKLYRPASFQKCMTKSR
jgi:hypothetical protein